MGCVLLTPVFIWFIWCFLKYLANPNSVERDSKGRFKSF